MRREWRIHGRSGTWILCQRADLIAGEQPCNWSFPLHELDVWARGPLGVAPLHALYVALTGSSPLTDPSRDPGWIERVVIVRLRRAIELGELAVLRRLRDDLRGLGLPTNDDQPPPPAPAPPPQPTPVNPLVAPSPVVVVKRTYTNPARKLVTLRTDAAFDGQGTFTVSNQHVKFFRAPVGGAPLAFDGVANVFPGAQLTAAVQLWAEGATPSASMDDVTLTLALSGGSRPVGPPASARMTSVELTLDLCQSRLRADADPAIIAGDAKFDDGRFVQVQDAGGHAGRAKLIVRKAVPHTFTGTLELTAENGNVRLFAVERGGAVTAVPHAMPNASIPAASGSVFWVEGVAVDLRSGFRLGIQGVESDGDRVKAKVVQLTRIRTVVRPTPANTARAGFPAPADHTFDTTSIDDDFGANAPLVLMRNAQPDVALEVTIDPPGIPNLPLYWKVIRNPLDHQDLKGADPVVTQDAAHPERATLNANGRGSFRVRAFIDCNGQRDYEDLEPSIPLNLVLADVQFVADRSVARPVKLSATIDDEGNVNVRNGQWAWGNSGMHMELIADVTGGGAHGMEGLAVVRAGLVNQLEWVDIHADFTDAAGVHPVRNVYVSNPAGASGNYGKPAFCPGDPAPAEFVYPVLDSGKDPEGVGGDSATMTSSETATVPRPVGQRWTIRCMDSPGRFFRNTHPARVDARLTAVHYDQRFRAQFCFWTQSAERTYSVVLIMPWSIGGDWTVAHPAAAPGQPPPPPRLDEVHPHTISIGARTRVAPPGRAQDHAVEVRLPSGIHNVAWDARS